MGLFKKKKKTEIDNNIPTLPDLPELPGLSELPTLPSEAIPDVPAGLPEIETNPTSQTLPTLHSPQIKENSNQESIKQEIRKPESIKHKSPKPSLMPSISQSIPKPIEHIPGNIEQKRTLELPEQIKRPTNITKKLEPVFIRLDKFQTTVQTFEEIKSKIQEIEELLSKTREIKQKEEEELADWEREIQTIKARIDLIDKTIFNKLD